MRTTLDLNDQLLRRAKRRAAEEKIPLRRLVERALRREVDRKGGAGTGYRLRWATESGSLQPGVSIEDRDALFDLMDGRR